MFNYENELLLNKARQEELVRKAEAKKDAKQRPTIWRILRSQIPAARLEAEGNSSEKR